MKNFVPLVRFGIALVPCVILTLVAVTPAASQSTVSKVVITSVNVDAFPEVRVQVKPVDANGAFIPGISASQFSLQEDGETVQIEKVSTESLPLNVRVVFVVDELVIAPHVQVVREAIQSFAENQMQAGDVVKVLAASESGTQTIVDLTSDPEEVVNGITNYDPGSASGTLLLDAVNQGLTELSALSENTEGLNRMVVFSVSINDTRDLGKTIEKAVQLGIPIHTVLLGEQDTAGALGRLARATLAGEGTISPEGLNDLFETLDAQSVQDQYLITYRSKVDQPGDHELVVAVGGVSSNATAFTLDQLDSPLVSITAPASDTLITRTETFFGQDPETIQPAEQTVAVEVTWPDGHPREIVLEKTTLVVNGRSFDAQTTKAKIRGDNGKDPVILELTWDLRQENTPGETPISIVVEAEDELGLKGISEPLTLSVDYVPFVVVNACPDLILKYTPALCSNFNLILPLGSLAVAVIALVYAAVYVRRNPKVQQQVKERIGTMMTRMGGTRIGGPRSGGSPGATMMVEPVESAKALLVAVEGRTGSRQTEFRINETTTMGRSSDHAKLVFQSDQGDRSPISRLHCTVLEKEGFFDLRDEGSSNGTFLNGARLKQGELHRLRDGDMVELARVPDGGVKLKFQAVARSAHMGTRLVAPEKKDSDDLPKDGYTPTKLM